MSKLPEKYRFVFRYVFGLMGLAAVASLAVILSFYFAQKADREAHERIAFYHVESTGLAERVRRDNLSLLRLLGFDIPDTAELVAAGNRGVRRGPDTHGILRMIASRVNELRDLGREYGEAEYAATLHRINERFRAVEVSILAHEPADLSRHAILSFDVAVEQLFRQHTIAAEVAHPDIDSVIARMTPYAAIVAAILIAVGTVSWITMRLLRRSIARQAAAEILLAENTERMHHLEKLESIGRLVGGVTHDFNNLLTAILGQTGLLLDKPGDERTRYGLVQIREAGQQAAALTRQLLNFSRPQPSEVHVVDVNELIRSIEVIVTRVIGTATTLKIDYGDDVPPVELDPAQLQQVIVNLAVNARDAMPDGGTLSITTQRTAVAPSHDESAQLPAAGYAKISVADTGDGMDKQTLERIFEPYFTTKAKGRGTGLGLSTVYGVVKGAGGFVDVTSRPGAGSRFEAILPGSTKDVSYAASGEVPGLDVFGEEAILIVEDEQSVREFVRDGLEGLGYRVLVAADAAEAINLLEENGEQIQVILADAVLPGQSGVELIVAARELQPNVTALLMTGYSDDHLARKGIDKASLPLIYKPFEIAEVASLIRRQRRKELSVYKKAQQARRDSPGDLSL